MFLKERFEGDLYFSFSPDQNILKESGGTSKFKVQNPGPAMIRGRVAWDILPFYNPYTSNSCLTHVTLCSFGTSAMHSSTQYVMHVCDAMST